MIISKDYDLYLYLLNDKIKLEYRWYQWYENIWFLGVVDRIHINIICVPELGIHICILR